MEKDDNTRTSEIVEVELKDGKKGKAIRTKEGYVFVTSTFSRKQADLIIILLVFILGVVILYGIYQGQYIEKGFEIILENLEYIQKSMNIGNSTIFPI